MSEKAAPSASTLRPPRYLYKETRFVFFAEFCRRGNWVPECSGGSFCSGASEEEDRKERVRGEKKKKKKKKKKEKETERKKRNRGWEK
ncbi:hypothetical protein EYF80_043938 [Liparis tanakae]|uniref:Uncharacterized protein n=1 Tax=Liparis tanakae TaxID=230148 RepID=A0A4Z2FY90_9TELE|nr:hypothetical protein EYF80_043938 [Liparis tanakae]